MALGENFFTIVTRQKLFFLIILLLDDTPVPVCVCVSMLFEPTSQATRGVEVSLALAKRPS